MSERLLNIFQQSYRELRPRAPIPELCVEFFAYANVNNTIRLREGKLIVRLSDLLEGAPETVLHSLAHILLAKMYRKPIERAHGYPLPALCLQPRNGSARLTCVRQMRGRKHIDSAKGEAYDLEVFSKN